jgi:hypothetical protein
MADTKHLPLPADDPFNMPIEERERLMRRGVIDAARVYKMHGVKMIAGDEHGNIREVDPDDVLKHAEQDEKSPSLKAG